jgi:outer membrane protein assembly factor BamB
MKKFCTAAFALAAMAVALNAATTATWEMNTYQDFLRGRFDGLSLDHDGRLTVAPKLETVFSSGQPTIWSIARAPDGSIYAGTGHRGRVYQITASGADTLVWSSKLIWTSDQPEIFAVAVDPSGVVYAATSPEGKVYRIEKGKASEFFAPQAKYIWALAFAKDGTLFVGAGNPGNIYRVDKTGKAETYYETGQSHVTALAFDSRGNVLAGTEPNGILYRVSAKDKAFVLYNANLPEIRSIIPMPDGAIYAAALGGSIANRTTPPTNSLSSPLSIAVTAPATSITVTDSADSQADTEIKPKASAPSPAAPPPLQPVGANASPIAEIPGVDKSAIYKINSDDTVETLWTSKDENVYSMAVEANGSVYFATDGQGRLYKLGADRKATLMVETNEGEATRLLDGPGGLVAATGDMGKLFRLADGAGTSGSYESPVHDSGSVARWGRITWRSSPGGKVQVQTRSGNSARADKTWSDWSEPLTNAQNSLIRSPNARFIQWRASLDGPGAAIENVSIAYLPQNNPPVIRSISVTMQPNSGAALKSAASSTSVAYSVTVTDTGETSTPAGTPTQTLSHGSGSQIQITWQADDPDGDRLLYSLYFRGEDEKAWKLLRANIPENSLLLDGDVLADGRYYFRVIASDQPSNAANVARTDELVSSPVLIDNTPPVVSLSPPRRNNDHVEVDADVVDQTSPLRRCEYSLDAGPWTPVEAADGVTDGPREQFHIAIDRLRAGEHLLVVRAYDTANNAGLAKVVIP